MELSKAKAFSSFILEARNAFDRVFSREITEKELESIKATYSGAEFERNKKEFDAELLANYKEYRDESLLMEYIRATLQEGRTKKFSIDVNGNILKNEWETGFLLNLKKDIESQLRLIELFYDFNHDFEHEELMYYCQRLEAAENSIDEVDKLISIANLPPAMDSRFDFELLLKECERLTTLTERIKLITKRVYEFKQWKIQNNKVNDGFGEFLVTDYSDLYYTKFEKLCELEFKKLEELNKLEISAPNTTETNKMAEAEEVRLTYSDYIWKSSGTDLLELAAALYQNKSIERRDGKDMTRKELIDFFQKLFDTNIAFIEDKLTKASGRNDKTPFLDNLSQQFINFADGKEAKKAKRR